MVPGAKVQISALYQPAPPASLSVKNLGDVIRVSGDGLRLSLLVFDHATYALSYIDFHHKSEHEVNGVRYPLEAQLVHTGEDGRLLIMSVLFAETNGPNAALDKLPWAGLVLPP